MLEQLTNLIVDKDFQALSTRCVDTSVFDLFKLDENKKSACLAWLLNPSEGHMQGEYFLRALLNHVYSCATQSQRQYMPKITTILTQSYAHLSVIRELHIKHSREQGYIDLFLASPEHKLLIIIERKDGSKLDRNQLDKYETWANVNYPKWRKIFILSDSESKDHGEQYNENYVSIDDTWLSDAILDLLKRDILPPRQECQFRDLHDYVFGDWSESRDPHYRQYDKLLKQVSKNHCELLIKLEEQLVNTGNKRHALIEISPAHYFGNILPNSDKYSREELKACELIQQHHYEFSQLHGLNEFDDLADSLKVEFKNIKVDLYSDAVCLIHRKHAIQSDNWPYYLKIARDASTEEGTFYNTSINVSRYSPEECHETAEKVADIFKIQKQRNWKSRKVIIIENERELDISINSKLRSEIEKFLDQVSGI
ncbi:PD-(D/E)XK nuclease family protein [Pseudoalteromonas rubra]|uniref:PD-(D/E)XK nuclease superfamily protein n=1 Tax=Pseudoalteromonas rubra TaxID=43658 RepID=A0A0U3HYB2_9GAMM|nr:PD-(D/E)XK nuclease family protein [Pseudoalteromonas rubra]ALU46056.1 hypothetical protein AT705_19535 [Pseudoalteromonas rubra]